MMDAEKLHRESLVIDGHCDTILSLMDRPGWPGYRKRGFFVRNASGHIDLPRLKEGGVTCQVMALYIEPPYKPTRSARRVMEMLDAFYALLDESEDFELATCAKDIERAKSLGKTCALLSIEGGEAVEGSLGLLREYYRLGVRAMGLTWNQRNDIADGCGEKSAGSGLTDFGVSLVKEMERIGMLVDVSHLSDSSFWAVANIAERPFIASHSNCRAVASHRRNLTDEQIEALAKKGGVIGVVFCPAFVDENRDNVSLKRICDHIDHLKSVVGVDHIGIGSDFDGYGSPLGGPDAPKVVISDVSEMPKITEELVSRGYTEEEIKKILGGNWLRVYREVLG
jgi:membrane dipeptidase